MAGTFFCLINKKGRLFFKKKKFFGGACGLVCGTSTVIENNKCQEEDFQVAGIARENAVSAIYQGILPRINLLRALCEF